MPQITYEQLKANEAVHTCIAMEDEGLVALGYTEHSFAHVTQVAERAGYIFETRGYPERTVELVKIAAYLHDIGNILLSRYAMTGWDRVIGALIFRCA